MSTLSQLTPEEFKALLNGYYATTERRHNMTNEEIDALASRINEKFDIPLVKESGEQCILRKVVLRVDNFLYNNLPNELYDMVRSVDKGISDKEAKKLIRRLTRIANDKLDIPYVPEMIEKQIYRLVISTVINAARKDSVFEQEAKSDDNFTFAKEE